MISEFFAMSSVFFCFRFSNQNLSAITADIQVFLHKMQKGLNPCKQQWIQALSYLYSISKLNAKNKRSVAWQSTLPHRNGCAH